VRTRLPARDLALIAVFAALIAALGLVPPIQVSWTAVPITAQTLGVMLAGSILGARRGALAVGTFLVLVAAGLPLLSGGRGGLSVFVSPSGGFLVGFLFGAWVIGALVERRPPRLVTGWIVLANLIGGIVVVYAFGVAGMAWFGHLSVVAAAVKCATFLPGDLIKVAVASVVTAGVVRGYPAAVHTAARREEPVS
jgi:biotin transport system substrate-specific component